MKTTCTKQGNCSRASTNGGGTSSGGCIDSINSPEESWIRYEVIFGLRRRNGTIVSDTEWDEFVTTQIQPCFPDGFTQLKGEGFWRSPKSGRPITEPSRILVLFRPANERGVGIRLSAIRLCWELGFDQDSVLISATRCQCSF